MGGVLTFDDVGWGGKGAAVFKVPGMDKCHVLCYGWLTYGMRPRQMKSGLSRPL
jgi:hypothetical protein